MRLGWKLGATAQASSGSLLPEQGCWFMSSDQSPALLPRSLAPGIAQAGVPSKPRYYSDPGAVILFTAGLHSSLHTQAQSSFHSHLLLLI